jgi:phosphohistidine phosphatase
MRQAGLVPDRALVSAARRTRETWALLAQELPPVADVRVSQALYEAAPKTLLGLVREQLEEAPNLLFVGHNPGLQGLALLLAQDNGAAHRAALAAKFPTAGLVVLRFLYEDWADVGPATGVIEGYVTPKSLGDAEAED